jgi:hypothetical protein
MGLAAPTSAPNHSPVPFRQAGWRTRWSDCALDLSRVATASTCVSLTIASVITTAAPSKAQIPVVDPLGLSGGTFTLQTRSGVGKCVPHEGAADVRIGLADLATMYMGAHRPSQLLRAGRLTELRQDVVRDLDAAFSTDRIPFCGTLF